MRESGTLHHPISTLLRDDIGYRIPRFPNKNQPVVVGFGVQSLGFRVWDSGFGVYGLGFRVQGWRLLILEFWLQSRGRRWSAIVASTSAHKITYRGFSGWGGGGWAKGSFRA